MWNLKNKTNEQNRNRLIDTENKLMIARRMGFGETDEIQWRKLKDTNSQL